jgi:glycosyltransferase XagB
MPETACFQASLKIYNDNASWLTRQFSLEYLALFDWILPALRRHGLPIPLGGTSNHFRREALLAAGAWDPFNVTEDADLGIRLARLGQGVDVLASETYEEAPPTWNGWKPQRTRWLKGWMQTFAVHNRQPNQLRRDLGWRAFIGFQILFGGILLSALVHPLFYLSLAYQVWTGAGVDLLGAGAGSTVWWIGLINLGAGYAASGALAIAAALRYGKPRLILSIPLLPIYWLLISWAAYRALWQMVRQPFYWEKTNHAARTGPSEPEVTS